MLNKHHWQALSFLVVLKVLTHTIPHVGDDERKLSIAVAIAHDDDLCGT
jgi:hypothetical protein